MDLAQLFKRAYTLWRNKTGDVVDRSQEVFYFFHNEIKESFQVLLKEYTIHADPFRSRFSVKLSTGMGRWVRTPWISISQPDISPSPQTGLYIVYFISLENEGIFLTLNQGTEKISREEIRENTEIYQKEIRKPQGFIKGLGEKIINNTDRGIKWTLGTVYSKFYPINSIEKLDNELKNDLNKLLKSYLKYIEEKNLTDYKISEIDDEIDILEKKILELIVIRNKNVKNHEDMMINIGRLKDDLKNLFINNESIYHNMDELWIEIGKLSKIGYELFLENNYDESIKASFDLYDLLSKFRTYNKQIHNNNNKINLLENNLIEYEKTYDEYVINMEQNNLNIQDIENQLIELKSIKITLTSETYGKTDFEKSFAFEEYEEIPEYDAFIAYYRATGSDFATHLKNTLDAQNFRAFIDVVDIPKTIKNQTDSWWKYRDGALIKSHNFILIMTAGFEKRDQLKKEYALALKETKEITHFLHKNLSYKIQMKINGDVISFSNYELTSFNTQYELAREAMRIFRLS